MPRPTGLLQWQHWASTHPLHLSAPQRQTLACWSFGIVLAQRCGRTSIATLLALLRDQPDQTLRARLRD